MNVAVPEGVSAGNTQLSICAFNGGQQYCSTGYALMLQ